MDLVEILKGHEGCELWSPIFGKCILKSVDIIHGSIKVTPVNDESGLYYFNYDGKICADGEVLIFPSEHQRDWSRFGMKIKEGDPVMVSNKGIEWVFRRYAKDKLCWESFPKGTNVYEWVYIVPFHNFDPYNLESNKQKSI